jgi:hypothetical protein
MPLTSSHSPSSRFSINLPLRLPPLLNSNTAIYNKPPFPTTNIPEFPKKAASAILTNNPTSTTPTNIFNVLANPTGSSISPKGASIRKFPLSVIIGPAFAFPPIRSWGFCAPRRRRSLRTLVCDRGTISMGTPWVQVCPKRFECFR